MRLQILRKACITNSGCGLCCTKLHRRFICCPQGDAYCRPHTMGTWHPDSITFHVGCALHSQGFVSSLHRLLSLSNSRLSHFLSLSLSVCCPFSCTLLSFVMELLKNSVAMQEQVLACKGFLVIGYTLEKVRQTKIGSAGREKHESPCTIPVAACNEPRAVIRLILIPLTPQTHTNTWYGTDFVFPSAVFWRSRLACVLVKQKRSSSSSFSACALSLPFLLSTSLTPFADIPSSSFSSPPVVALSVLQSSKVHVTRPVLDIVLAFSRYLSNLQNGILLLKQLCDHILFNPAIWIHAPAKVTWTHSSTFFCIWLHLWR